MAKYLDCDPLIEEMRIYKCGEEDYDEGIETAISVCAVFPPANVRSVVLGEWEERRKHKWKRYSDGTIDCFAGVDCGYHNGPLCLKCGFSFCEHCDPKGYDSECSVPDYICTVCGSEASEKWNFCPNCGADMRRNKRDG